MNDQFRKRFCTASFLLAFIFFAAGCSTKSVTIATSSNGTTGAYEDKGGKNPEKAVDGKSLKAALCMTGSRGEPGWNASAYEGLEGLEARYGIATTCKDRLNAQSLPDAVEALAENGNQLIIGVGGDFSKAVEKTAKKYPDVKFVCIQGNVSSTNAASFSVKREEPAYLAGLMASSMSISNQIGFIGPGPDEFCRRAAAAFESGAREGNPDVTTQMIWLDDPGDTARSRQAVNDMVDSGADIIYQCTDTGSLGILEAVYQGGIMGFGEIYDQGENYPRTVITSAVYDTARLVDLAAQDVLNGNFKGEVKSFGFVDGVIHMTPYGEADSRVPKKLKNLVAEKIEDISSGKFTVPTEPLG